MGMWTGEGAGPDIGNRYALAIGQQQIEKNQTKNQKDIAFGQQRNALALAGINANSASNVAGIQAEASKYPATLAQGRFDRVFPFVQQQFGALSSQLGTGGSGGEGTGGFGPTISAQGVYSPEQIQGQANQLRAQNSQQAQSQTRTAARNLAGHGMSSQSPLLQALGAQYQGQAQQASTQGENDLRYQAAQGNATQQLKGQQAQEAQFASRQQEANDRRRIQAQQSSALLAALAGLI